MTATSSYEQLLKKARELADLSKIFSLLNWDERVNMPDAGARARAEQYATLAGILHEKRTAPDFVALLNELRASSDLNADSTVIVRALWRDTERNLKLPSALVRELAEASSVAHAKWLEARKANNFSIVSSALEHVIRLKRQYAQVIGTKTELYDVHLDLYEENMTAREVELLFGELQPRLTELLQAIMKKRPSKRQSGQKRTFTKSSQRELFLNVLQAMGFELERGRLDETVHPFCSELAIDDVRLATRYDENKIEVGLYGVMHEAGHGLYEQGFLKHYSGTPLAEAISLGIHESQSLLWERCIGRSRPFLEYLFPRMKGIFAESLTDCTIHDFYREVNEVEPTLIRTEADEVTYCLHIIVRFELERALIQGELSVGDLPKAWEERYSRYLGVTPRDALNGVLQDTHWYDGLFGYFPTYALGFIYAAQLFAKYGQIQPNWAAAIAAGDTSMLRAWLTENVYRHGRRYGPRELIERATGEPPNSEYLVQYLKRKYGELYGL